MVRFRWMEMAGQVDSSDSLPRTRLSSSRPYTPNGVYIPILFYNVYPHPNYRFTDRIAPWVHYIPVQVDLSDLYDSLMFFRGDLHGNNAHDDLARKIASAGREWSLRYWRKEDLTAYMFR